jgi:replicative DNA helicase
MTDSKLPPQNMEAEMSVLGGILLDNSAIDTVHTILNAESFYRESHRKIFRAMSSLADRNEPVDLITLSTELKAAGDLEEVGGAPYLVNLIDYVPTSANIAYYCKLVEHSASVRKIIAAAQESTQILYGGGEIAEAIAKLETAIQPSVNHSTSPVPMNQSIREVVRRLEHRYESRGEIQGIPYGLSTLDAVTSGMHRGELIIIAGRPSMGKSALAGNILDSVCSGGMNGLLFTLEMSRGDIIDRLVSGKGIKYHHIRSGRFHETDWSRIIAAASAMNEWKLSVDDTPGIALREIRAKARRQKKDGLDVLVIDYLQLMVTPGKDNRTREIGDISRGLKQLARELDMVVILLSQLNRAVDSRPDKRPLMSDLRESGEIEQDADVILFPFRPAAYCPKCKDRIDDGEHDYREHQGKAEVIIEKQRAGERNISIPVEWIGQYQKFVEREK